MEPMVMATSRRLEARLFDYLRRDEYQRAGQYYKEMISLRYRLTLLEENFAEIARKMTNKEWRFLKRDCKAIQALLDDPCSIAKGHPEEFELHLDLLIASTSYLNAFEFVDRK